MELLLSRDGVVQVANADAVRSMLLALHANVARRRALGENARRVCLESKGATRRILEILSEHLPGHPVADSAVHDKETTA